MSLPFLPLASYLYYTIFLPLLQFFSKKTKPPFGDFVFSLNGTLVRTVFLLNGNKSCFLLNGNKSCFLLNGGERQGIRIGFVVFVVALALDERAEIPLAVGFGN